MSNQNTGQNKELLEEIRQNAESGGYILNPDNDFTVPLIDGLAVNESRYGYRACPCRLADGVLENDVDIICPCDYRDADINDYGACFCGLYVSRAVAEKKQVLKRVPERRNREKNKSQEKKMAENTSTFKYPIWRCSVCGYICARENPPDVCPICKVGKERFERFV